MLILRRVRVPLALTALAAEVDAVDPAVECDVLIDGERIETVALAGEIPARPGVEEMDLAGSLVFPGLVCCRFWRFPGLGGFLTHRLKSSNCDYHSRDTLR
jgi:hypothetical protein